MDRDDDLTEQFSEFVPGLSCDHQWHRVPGGEYCPGCGAHCQRDSRGLITLYSRPAPTFEQEQKEQRLRDLKEEVA